MGPFNPFGGQRRQTSSLLGSLRLYSYRPSFCKPPNLGADILEVLIVSLSHKTSVSFTLLLSHPMSPTKASIKSKAISAVPDSVFQNYFSW